MTAKSQKLLEDCLFAYEQFTIAKNDPGFSDEQCDELEARHEKDRLALIAHIEQLEQQSQQASEPKS